MAFMNFNEPGYALQVVEQAQQDRQARPATALSALEWSVVALAERDHPSTLREPGRVAIALGALFSGRHNPRLADPRLEALRRMAVLTWRYGYVVPSAAIRDFLSAGFTTDQYELLANSIGVARAKRKPGTVR